jgi:hypothetical protein
MKSTLFVLAVVILAVLAISIALDVLLREGSTDEIGPFREMSRRVDGHGMIALTISDVRHRT